MDQSLKNELISQLNKAVNPEAYEKKKEEREQESCFSPDLGRYEVHHRPEEVEQGENVQKPEEEKDAEYSDSQLEDIMERLAIQRKGKHKKEEHVDPRLLFLREQQQKAEGDQKDEQKE
ncbi:MAG: hypothetical protein ACI4HI_10285 [Lachnospiraceae bacterium]